MDKKIIIPIFILIFTVISSVESYAREKYSIVIVGPAKGVEIRNPFAEQLLHLCFDKNDMKLELIYSKENLTQNRAIKELQKGNVIDLDWTVTTNDREQGLLSVKIPIYRGLIGWRVFFISPNKQPVFSKIKTINDIKNLSAIQPLDWPDHKILKTAGLQVEGNIPFKFISKALNSGLADYYPRSVLEINYER